MKILSIITIFLVLVVLDKGLTIANIKAVQANFPEQVKDDPYKIEKNPVSKWCFNKFGLYGGSLIMALISLATIALVYFFLNRGVGGLWGLYIPFIIYSLVVMNNLFFLLKHLGVFRV